MKACKMRKTGSFKRGCRKSVTMLDYPVKPGTEVLVPFPTEQIQTRPSEITLRTPQAGTFGTFQGVSARGSIRTIQPSAIAEAGTYVGLGEGYFKMVNPNIYSIYSNLE
jgi:hypothetical protein